MRELHVFLVHSNIALIAAMSIIDTRAIPCEDVHFAFYRGYTARVSYASSNFPIQSTDGKRTHFYGTTLGHVLTARQKLNALDLYLSDLSGGRPFHLYLPHTKFDFFRLVVNSSLCAGFSVYEEGSAAFRVPTEAAMSSRVRTAPTMRGLARAAYCRALYGKRATGAQSYSHFSEGASNYYAFSEGAFGNTPGRLALDLERGCQLSSDVLEVLETEQPSIIVVLDNMNYLHDESPDSYAERVRTALLREVSSGMKRIHVKDHPANKANARVVQLVQGILETRTGAILNEIRAGVSLELTAWKHKETTFLVRHSSVGHYARILGATVRDF